MDIDERVIALEKSMVMVTEALRFQAEQAVRDDREHELIRDEAKARYEDHEGRLRASEKALWALGGLTSGTFLAVVVPAVLKALTS